MQVRALRALGHDVLCIIGFPKEHGLPDSHRTKDRVLSVPLSRWQRLTSDCSWEEFADGSVVYTENVRQFEPEICLGVDWHSVRVFQNLCRHGLSKNVPYIFCNYRIFLRDVKTKKEHEIIYHLEGEALRQSEQTFVLSSSDAEYLVQNYEIDEAKQRCIHVLIPPLRSDMAALPVLQLSGFQNMKVCKSISMKPRRFLTCCVRASPEKEPHNFVDLVIELQKRGILDRLNIIPVIIGSTWKINVEFGKKQESRRPRNSYSHVVESNDLTTNTSRLMGNFSTVTPGEAYAEKLRRKLEIMIPKCIFVDEFLGPDDLSIIYSQTILNIHPCRWDAFGMTIVEAASQCAPSLLDAEGVGAAELLKPSEGLSFHISMGEKIDNIANFVEDLVKDMNKLEKAGQAAMTASRSWTEKANVLHLLKQVENVTKRSNYPSNQDVINDLKFFETCVMRNTMNIDYSEASRRSRRVPVGTHTDFEVEERRIPQLPLETRNGVDVYDVHELDLLTFNMNYLYLCRPVIIKGLTQNWKATHEWIDKRNGEVNIEFLDRKFGGSSVPVTEIRRFGDDIISECIEMKLKDFCQWWTKRKLRTSENFQMPSNNQWVGKRKDATDESQDLDKANVNCDCLLYLKDWHFASEHPNYTAYICPKYFEDDWINEWLLDRKMKVEEGLDEEGNGRGLNHGIQASEISCSDYRFFYLGPAGSHTSLHADVFRSHSWSANLTGRKRWKLLAPEYCHKFENATTGALPRTFDDADNFNEISSHIMEVIQYPDETVFVPSQWWHTVENLDDCLSINHNWISSSSALSTWKHLQSKHEVASELIKDCRDLNGPISFEILVQKNLAAETGMDYFSWGELLRHIAQKCIDRRMSNGASSMKLGKIILKFDFDINIEHELSNQQYSYLALHRANKIMILLQHLLDAQVKILEKATYSPEMFSKRLSKEQIQALQEEEATSQQFLHQDIKQNHSLLQNLQNLFPEIEELKNFA